MALYEFVCKKCSNKFNEQVPMSEITEAVIKCPKCKSKNTKRVYSQCNFKITSERIEMAKKQGLNIERYEQVKEKRDKKQKEKLESGDTMANDAVVSKKLKENIVRNV
jgi:putative FmdB family regulatory protein